MKNLDLSTIMELSRVRFVKIIDFFYDNWEAMKLLVCSSTGSSYEHIFDKAIDLKEIFYHDLKKSEAMEYVLDFNTYHCAGWKQYWMEQINH